MKRMHIHVHVEDLESSIRFYENLYGAPATVRKIDYAKWVLDDPRVNFAISPHGANGSTVSHLGVEVDNSGELEEFNTRLQSAEAEKDARCCYAVSDKYWATDPGGVSWEFFYTRALSETFGASGAGH